MNKMGKRILAFVLALMMVLSTAFTSIADTHIYGDDDDISYRYELDEEILLIDDSGSVKKIAIKPDGSSGGKTVDAKIIKESEAELEIEGSSSTELEYSITCDSELISLSENSVTVPKGEKSSISITAGSNTGSAVIEIIQTKGDSTNRKGTVNLSIVDDEEEEPEPDVTVEMTPQSENGAKTGDPIPSENRTVGVNGSVKVVLKNSSTHSDYDYAIEYDTDGIASSSVEKVSTPQGGSGSVTFTALKEGIVKITFRNKNQDPDATYERFAYLTLKVGEGSEEPTPPAPSGDETTLAFTSDVHNQSGDVSSKRLDNWLTTVSSKINDTFDTIGICGDLGPASGSSNDFWSNAKKVYGIIDENGTVENDPFVVCGNHEYNPGNYTHNLNDTTKLYKDVGEFVVEEDYILYSMGARQWNEIYSDSDINAMTTFLENHEDFDGAIFILAHFPIHCYDNKSGESSGIHDGKAAMGSGKIITALNEMDNAHNIVFIAGHNHSRSIDYYDKICTDKINDTPINFTYCLAGCMSDSEYGQSANVKGKGLVASIDDDEMVLTYYGTDYNVVGTPATIELTGEEDPTATYHTITASAGTNGSISPEGEVNVKEGNSKSFTFIPDAGYLVDEVKVDGKVVTISGNSYKFENVTKDAAIEVSFKESDYLWEVTPSTDNPSKTVTLEAGKQYKVKVTNGSSNNQSYTFKGSFKPARIATLDPVESNSIAAGESTEFTLTAGSVNGTTVLTITNGNSSSERKATLNITVTGGTEAELISGGVDVTPTTENPEVNATVAAGKILAVNITNGTENNNEWDFSATSADEKIAKVLEPSTVTIGAGETETIEVEGVAKGTVDLTIRNSNDMEEYLRTAVVHLTVLASDAKVYTVTFETNGGSKINSQTVVEGEKAKEPTAPTKSGVEFDGWYTDSDLTKKFSFDTAVTSNLTLYAKWLKPEEKTYTVTWKNYDGNILEIDTDVRYGTNPSYNGSTPTRAGTAQYDYTFSGWMPAMAPVTGDATYTAQFTAIEKEVEKYVITFDVQGHGLTPAAQIVNKNAKVTEPEALTADGYTFGGWYREKECLTPWDFSEDIVTDNIFLYAKWIQNIEYYDVTWKNWDNSILEADSKVAEGSTPVYNGSTPTRAADSSFIYTFSGWTPEVVAVTGDAVYTATYTKKSKGSSGGGNGSSSGGGSGSSSVSLGSGLNNGAPAYSPRWQKRADGKWFITRTNGQIVTNAWLCDDVVPSNGKKVWYLIQADGTMLVAGLVQDNTGNFYSMEMDPNNQYYGMLRYKSGLYYCNGQLIYLELEENNTSSLGAIKNADAIAKLKAIYGLTTYPIGNENAVYTSNF